MGDFPFEGESPPVEKPKETKKAKRKTKSGMVKVKVVHGSVSFRDETSAILSYEKGDTFTTTREQAESLDQRFIQIV